MMDNKNSYALPFAAWELRLYLDTHPNDKEALAQFKALCEASGSKCNYACHTADKRSIARKSGCECENNSRAARNNGGCGCESNRTTRNSGSCSVSYGGRHNDVGGYAVRQSENGGCGCGCDDDGVNNDNDNVWSWIEGPWPWEPEANVTGGNC